MEVDPDVSEPFPFDLHVHQMLFERKKKSKQSMHKAQSMNCQNNSLFVSGQKWAFLLVLGEGETQNEVVNIFVLHFSSVVQRAMLMTP